VYGGRSDASRELAAGSVQFDVAKGTVGVFFTLAPTQPPAVQHLTFRKLDSEAVRLGAPTGARAGVGCSE